MKVAGAKVSPRLVQRLLNDVGDDPDQLPVLQHDLMRTWDVWRTASREGDVLDVDAYEQVGRLAGALSQHADEVYEELSLRSGSVTPASFSRKRSSARATIRLSPNTGRKASSTRSASPERSSPLSTKMHVS